MKTPYIPDNSHFLLSQTSLFLLVGVKLLDFIDALVQCAIYCRRHRQRASNDCAQTDEEARKRLFAHFAIDDLHGRNVLFLPQTSQLS